MKKLLKIFAILMISALVFSCGGSGGSSEGDAPVKVSFNIETPHADIAKTVSVDDPAGSLTYWYAAIPQWTGVDFKLAATPAANDIQGYTGGTDANPTYVQINNYTANANIGYFAQGTWKFYAQVKSGDTVVYQSSTTPGTTYINESSTSVSLTVERTTNGSATVSIDVEVPNVSAGTVLTAAYSPAGANSFTLTPHTMTDETVANRPTHGAGWTRFIGSASINSGSYLFTLTSNDGTHDVGGAVLAFDVIAGVDRKITGTIENGAWQTVLITINKPSISITLAAANSATSMNLNGSLVYTCSASTTNVTGDISYAWFVDGSPVAGTASQFTYHPTALGEIGYHYITCKAYVDGKITGSQMLGVAVNPAP